MEINLGMVINKKIRDDVLKVGSLFEDRAVVLMRLPSRLHKVCQLVV